MPKKKLKNYKVRLMAVCDVLVISANDEAQAIKFAEDEVFNGSFEVLEMTTTELTTPEQVEAARRHCGVTAEP